MGITGGAVVTSIVMYPVDVVRAICMSNPGTGAGEALSGFLKAHGMMGFVKRAWLRRLRVPPFHEPSNSSCFPFVTKLCTVFLKRRVRQYRRVSLELLQLYLKSLRS